MTVERAKAPTVLLIDDDRGVRSLLTGVLSDAGWAVMEASNGYTGLRRAEHDAPDLILLDLALPEMDGLAVLDELRRRPATRAVPVVAVTGHPDWVADRSGDISGVLSKPFDLDVAIAMVARLLAQARRSTAPIPPATTGYHERTVTAAPRPSGPPISTRT